MNLPLSIASDIDVAHDILTRDTSSSWHLAAAAMLEDCARRVRESVAANVINPAPTPEVTRYFTDGTNVWKFGSVEIPQHRFVDDTEWEVSAYDGLKQFEGDMGTVREITAEEGEPK
jgi:hypothetical protein